MTQFFETTQGIMVVGAMIGAGCFAAGIILPGALRWLNAERARNPKRDGRSAAMLTALALDDFVGAAYAAVHDTPEFNPANEGEFVFHTPDPVLVLPRAEDLNLLGEALFNETLWLSNRVTNLGNALDNLDLSSPGFDSFFERRQEGYAVLAAKAMDLIERLLADFDLSLPEKPDYYRQREGFASVVQAAGERETRAKKVASRVQIPGSNVTQLFSKTGEEGE
ncbi:hypothetical protein RJJ65_08795 [Rhizobium hidalgonense]|uniref:Uncharacterized protein n=1 Tax=Rhizobium hidalgonense TaxID=1538159 RepID=A0A2A6KFC3_9HYPH|nr:hypothetical protein [Rhizobium hidalgonense]MDR9772753.1 hypothetical protein [Rhizobium hidalgonense]MDR9812875.1 hypothetical protein [Rhizobium hidalgonense]MDR9820213.1 hypothetical protein [Rhizobium hidalgonense]PDT23105.1 hypothetical protein CO674_14315 [Rhizobium hidalgonense]PON01347.1 hypothetical protein ATY29_34770 [Rhizobium hidalgonense]